MQTRTTNTLIGSALALFCVWGTSGCSMSGMAVGAMIPVIDNSKVAALKSADLRMFREAAPANLFLIEGLIETKPTNRQLRESAAMLYFSYAFAFDEGTDDGYVSNLYLKGLEHGRAALLRNKAVQEFWDKPFDAFAAGMSLLSEKDLPALVWTVANWSQFISLHLDSTRVLTQIPRVQALLERACEIDGGYFEGLPYMMLGSLHAFRAPMFGGDPEASRASFERALEISQGKFLLVYFSFAKFYAYRVQDPDLFEESLMKVLDQPSDILPEYRLLNVIAKEKATELLKEKDELF